ncbi:nitrilase-related carbon-nitrogen hydrolase [Aurantimonas sp. A3-2-R12]|uniref:nitrilase-related carbon-nitrogen hydrolase n=1 Tax=Aurantimonas sp. A3-2-R12 TaxID=3114362 RepID=UPI002E18C94A|nr:nitrilase-related carbon-nitrogen hydrolase [Aurantimonas sp. A3-2-R12]
MNSKLIVNAGVAQIASVIGDANANVDKHLDWIADARRAGVDLLVFPELSLVGHQGPDSLLEAAMSRHDPRLIRLAEAAGEMRVVVGLIEEGPGAQFYNAAASLYRGGLEYIHRKVNLPTYGQLEEGKHFANGRFVDTYTLDANWRAGLLICADLWNPALTHLAFLHGATLLIAPISSGVEAVGAEFDNPGGWKLTAKFYSMMYGAPTILANRCGVEKDLTFWGGSRIVDPFGAELAVADDGERMIMAEIDYDQVRRARRQLPTVRDSNIDLVLRETERLVKQLGVPDFIRVGG